MKKFNVNVPEELAQEFEKKLHEIQNEFGGKLETAATAGPSTRACLSRSGARPSMTLSQFSETTIRPSSTTMRWPE